MSDCIETDWRRDRKGYGLGHVGRKTWRAHRLAWAQAHGPIPAGMFVMHRCDNPPCINVEHLFLGTSDDNVADRNAKRRQARGAANGRAKLTAEDVLTIRGRNAAGDSGKRLAREYRMNPRTVQRIITRKLWPHV